MIKSVNAKDSINKLVGYFWAIYQMNEVGYVLYVIHKILVLEL